MSDDLKSRLPRALKTARQSLLAESHAEGYWTGRLSSSALSTATAVCALALVDRQLHAEVPKYGSLIRGGLDWLAAQANADGGWGDTDKSLSNISTTCLGWASLQLWPDEPDRYAGLIRRTEACLERAAGGREPAQLARAIIRRYGEDRTFSIPILTHCALAGRLGSGREAWRHVPQLPFELAACPHAWFAALRLPVVSYALPALIAMGIARHHHRPTRNPILRGLRNAVRARSLRKLECIQPPHGGFLEATPLTSFVTMSLAGSGLADHPVARKGIQFLEASVRADGSWPIDTNLATWNTTLAVNSLALDREFQWDPARADAIGHWLENQQYRSPHPYTQAPPGGWSWTDLPGGVPDADDTPGALLALYELRPHPLKMPPGVEAGIRWLLNLQNRDGGIPTFCRGWGRLEFDRSSPDLTAHTLRAWLKWLPRARPELQNPMIRAVRAAVNFLHRSQRPDGSWAPLWFGNQFECHEENPLYGTSRVLLALTESGLADITGRDRVPRLAHAAAAFLESRQNPDGGWGHATPETSSNEETALVLEGLAAFHLSPLRNSRTGADLTPALRQGAEWLVHQVESGDWTVTSPIGFYFAKLWYYEALYPRIFTVGALGLLRPVFDSGAGSRPGRTANRIAPGTTGDILS